MTKLEIAKAATSFIVSVGASKITAQIIKNNTNPESVTEAVAMTGGAIVLGMIVADATKKYTDNMIDEIAAQCNKLLKKN